ncbi:MAG TPA: invasion associated locus B family protein [Sphingomonas sp.]|nr:invasion associated locus B family protein [Sphingomonas sp.]
MGFIAGPAQAARHAIAVFGDWGAFREDSAPVRCFAVAEPPPGTRAASRGAYAAVTSWPARRVRAQVSFRLSLPAGPGSPVTLTIDDRSFALTAKGRDAWARDRREDALIVATMRSASSMSVSAVSVGGAPFADGYRLRGAASAIDAAMLACPLNK